MVQLETTTRQYLRRRAAFLCRIGSISFWKFFLHWKEIVKNGATSGWADEDQLHIWNTHSSSTSNHLHIY